MQVDIVFVTDDERTGTFSPVSGRFEISDRSDEFGNSWGSNVFAGVTVTSVTDDNRVTSELAPGRYVEFSTKSGFCLEYWVDHVAVVIDGVTVWESE